MNLSLSFTRFNAGLTISERPYLDSVEMGKVIRHDGRSRYRF